MGRSDSTGKAGRPLPLPSAAMYSSVDLGVEAAGEHPLVLVDQLIRDVDVVELQARQLGLVRVVLASSSARRRSMILTRPFSRART